MTEHELYRIQSQGSSCCDSVIMSLTSVHEDEGLIPGHSCHELWCRSQTQLGSGVLLWLWCRPAAAAPIGPLAWELPYAVGGVLEKTNKQKKTQKTEYKSRIVVTSGESGKAHQGPLR